MSLEAHGSVRVADCRLDHVDSIDVVDAKMTMNEACILAERFEGHDRASGHHASGGKQRVEADICSDVEYHIACADHSSEQTLFGILVGAEPAAMVARTGYPPMATQRSLQDGHRERAGNERERQAQQPAGDGAIGNARDVHLGVAAALCEGWRPLPRSLGR